MYYLLIKNTFCVGKTLTCIDRCLKYFTSTVLKFFFKRRCQYVLIKLYTDPIKLYIPFLNDFGISNFIFDIRSKSTTCIYHKTSDINLLPEGLCVPRTSFYSG